VAYDILSLLLECILVFLLYFAFEQAVELLRGLTRRTFFEPLEILSLVLLSACLILGLKSFSYFDAGAHVLSLTIIFVSGLAGGFPISCAAGVTLGLVNSLSEVLSAQVVAVYAVSSLCAGLLQKKGRWGVTVGFFVANSLAALYFSSSLNKVVPFYCVIAAGMVLFLLPDRLVYMFGEAAKAPDYAEASVERLRQIMVDKLTNAAGSFGELSDLFGKVIADRVEEEMHDPGALFDRAADAVCRDCSLMHYCWQKEYNNTRRMLLTLYDKMEICGEAREKDVPAEFKHACIRLESFIEALNKSYELHKINMMWAGRVAESKQLTVHQFKNISSILEHIRQELTVAPVDALRLERKVRAALDRIGIAAKRVYITGDEVLRVSIEIPACDGERLCNGRIAAALSGALGVPMLRLPAECRSEGVCKVTFQEVARYELESGFAGISARSGQPSGDNYIVSCSGDGKYILALSDGMGQGIEANNQSGMTVHLIKRLLRTGFDKETALRLINSMLMVSGEKDSFATADLCLANLYSGALEFIKIGAVSSFVKRANGVERIHCATLPAGIVCEPEIDCALVYGASGDFVVMVTDGITDVLETGGKNHLQRLVENFKGTSPQALADEILQTALRASGGIPHDDMTVLTARLKEV